MKFLKRWLPVLLLALVIAIIPFLFSFPVSAATLEQYSYNGIVLPKLPEGSNVSMLWIDSLGNYCLTQPTKVTSVSVEGIVKFSSSYQFVDGEWVSVTYDFSNKHTIFWCSQDVYTHDGDLYLSGSDPVITFVEVPDPPIVFDPVDLLSVFTGVASWFSGAVGAMTSMFWTAEGSLTVLGVLAVASLAIAIIILLIYLLAGWLKFK